MVSGTQAKINDVMQRTLDKYLPHRKPVSLLDYFWWKIKPERVDDDIFDAIVFVGLVEANPRAPGDRILRAAEKSKAPWLTRFIKQTGLPEEGMHHVPFKEYLIRSERIDEATIDDLINDVKARGFDYGQKHSDVMAATYGWLQELITQRFYEAMGRYLVERGQEQGTEHDEVLVKILTDIGTQENFHRYIYLEGVKTILKHSPERRDEVIDAASSFVMPGHFMAPDGQVKAPKWGRKIGFPLTNFANEVSEVLTELIGVDGLGETTIRYFSKNMVPDAGLVGQLARFDRINERVGKMVPTLGPRIIALYENVSQMKERFSRNDPIYVR